MTFKAHNKYVLIILTPLILGLVIDNVEFISRIYSNFFRIFAILFIIFWFWSGKTFARLDSNKLKAFLIGNILWFLSFIFCLWLYRYEYTAYRNFFTDGIAQYYPMLLNPVTAPIVTTLTGFVSGKGLLKLSYIFMFIIFYSGFTFEIVRTTKRIRLIVFLISFCILVAFSIYHSPFIPRPHITGSTKHFTEDSPKQLRISYSNYSTLGFSIQSKCISKGTVSWRLMNPKGEIILSGRKSSEELVSFDITTNLEDEPIPSPNDPPRHLMIPQPSIPGKYTMIIDLSNASGYFGVGWVDTPALPM